MTDLTGHLCKAKRKDNGAEVRGFLFHHAESQTTLIIPPNSLWQSLFSGDSSIIDVAFSGVYEVKPETVEPNS